MSSGLTGLSGLSGLVSSAVAFSPEGVTSAMLVEWVDISAPYAVADDLVTPVAYGDEYDAILSRYPGAEVVVEPNNSDPHVLSGCGYDGGCGGDYGAFFPVADETSTERLLLELSESLTGDQTVAVVYAPGTPAQYEFGAFFPVSRQDQSTYVWPLRTGGPQVWAGAAVCDAQGDSLMSHILYGYYVLILRKIGSSWHALLNGVDVTDHLGISSDFGSLLRIGGWQSSVRHALFYTGAMNDSEATALTRYLTADITLIIHGNSLTAGFGLSTPRDSKTKRYGSRAGDYAAAAGINASIIQRGAVGRPMTGTYEFGPNQFDAAPAEVDAYFNPLSRVNSCLICETTNNIAISGRTGAQDLADNLACGAARIAAGCDLVILTTSPDRDPGGTGSPTNVQIRASRTALLALCDPHPTNPYRYFAKPGQTAFHQVIDIAALLGNPMLLNANPNFLNGVVDNDLHWSLIGHDHVGEQVKEVLISA